MSFEKQARSRAQGLVEALAAAAQKEMDALRAAVEARTGALHKALSHPDQASVLDRLVQDLSGAAKEEAEALAGKVRAEVQQQAEAALAAGRAELDRTRQELEKRLADAQKAHAALAGTLAEAQKDHPSPDKLLDAFREATTQLREFINAHKIVTIPSLPDKTEWDAFDAARRAMSGKLSSSVPAGRYGIKQ